MTAELHLLGCVSTLVRANSYFSQLATGSGNRSYCETLGADDKGVTMVTSHATAPPESS